MRRAHGSFVKCSVPENKYKCMLISSRVYECDVSLVSVVVCVMEAHVG